MSKTLKRPEWFGHIEITGPGGGSLPSLMYDEAKLPCGFALFTNKPKCDNFLNYKEGTKGRAARLGIDIKITQFQSWSLLCVDSILQAEQMRRGNKDKKITMPRDELATRVYMGMPVWINPKRPQVAGTRPWFENFLAVVQRYFTLNQLEEARAGGKLAGLGYLSADLGDRKGLPGPQKLDFTVATYALIPVEEMGAAIQDLRGEPRPTSYFALVVPGRVEDEADLITHDRGKLVLGANAHITETHKEKDGPLKEAVGWLETAYKEPAIKMETHEDLD